MEWTYPLRFAKYMFLLIKILIAAISQFSWVLLPKPSPTLYNNANPPPHLLEYPLCHLTQTPCLDFTPIPNPLTNNLDPCMMSIYFLLHYSIINPMLHLSNISSNVLMLTELLIIIADNGLSLSPSCQDVYT